jgi:D-cysteine desulfhydrase family pyridoxal phosphate-dependent enzyme
VHKLNPTAGLGGLPDTAVLARLSQYKARLSLAQLPTPIQRLSRLSDKLECSIYCKREDLTGFGFGGNKIRKLEYLVQNAIEEGADTLVTCGSNQSNWCCMTALVGAATNLDVHLLLGGGTPSKPTANLLLEQWAGARIHHLETAVDAELERASEEFAAKLEASGRKPVRILMGGSTWLGSLGYIESFREILNYERESGVSFSTIVVASGSGGTHAGLVAGQTLSGWKGSVIGMTTSRSTTAQLQRVRNILGQLDSVCGTNTAGANVTTNDSYVGGGYRKPTEACHEAIQLFARTEGIFLDEVYTGKAAAGLIDYVRKGRFGQGENILFIHTGGNVQLFE